MSTNALIIMQTATGYRGIYCHFDGYPSGVGKTLMTDYTDPKKVKALINLGAISYLKPSIEKPDGHSFEHPVEGYTVAYHRDRNEPKRILKASTLDAFSRLQYNFLFKMPENAKKGVWLRLLSSRSGVILTPENTRPSNLQGDVVNWDIEPRVNPVEPLYIYPVNEFLDIAADTLSCRISTLETRDSDRLDFYDIGVGGVRDALDAVFKLGSKGLSISDDTASQIAHAYLGIDTLETRNSDQLDFHDASIWGIREALEKAYVAGFKAQQDKVLMATSNRVRAKQ